MNGRSDYGLYQVCGPHPTTTAETLLYIGKANSQTFGKRFTGTDRQQWCPNGWGDNTVMLGYFVGRVHQTQDEPIDHELSRTYIDLAEKLLIFAHVPNWNAEYIAGITRERSADYDNYHVFNWGTRRSLLPEVSGARHGWTLFERLSDGPA